MGDGFQVASEGELRFEQAIKAIAYRRIGDNELDRAVVGDVVGRAAARSESEPYFLLGISYERRGSIITSPS